MFKMHGNYTLILLVFLIPGAFVHTNSNAKSLSSTEIHEYAKNTYIFTFPLVMMYRSMHRQAIDKKTGVGFGKWLHLGMSTPQDHDIVTSNNDTPNSYAWLDLRAEQWGVTLPPLVAQ